MQLVIRVMSTRGEHAIPDAQSTKRKIAGVAAGRLSAVQGISSSFFYK